MFTVDSPCVATSQRSHLLSHSLSELLGFLWVRSDPRYHLSSSSWPSGGRGAASALSGLLSAETDR